MTKMRTTRLLGLQWTNNASFLCSSKSRSVVLVPNHGRFFGTDPFQEPSKFVDGLSVEEVTKDPEIAAFLKANFGQEDTWRSRTERAAAAAAADTSIMAKHALDNPISDATQQLNIRKLFCYRRDTVEEEGSRRCQRLRDVADEIPGLVYGADPTMGISSKGTTSNIFVKTPWRVLQRELDLFHRSFECRVYDLTILEDETDTEGTVHRVTPTSVQRHPVQNKVYCTNYLRYHPKRPINIPITYINEEESPILKRGGFIAPISRHVSCLVEDGVPIPEKLELECTGLQLKEVARLDRIIFPEGVRISKLVKPAKFIVGTVFGRRIDPSEESK